MTVGQTASRSLTLTAEPVTKYAEMTGDDNPLHFDAAQGFLEQMPSAETLMPVLELNQVQGLLEQGQS